MGPPERAAGAGAAPLSPTERSTSRELRRALDASAAAPPAPSSPVERSAPRELRSAADAGAAPGAAPSAAPGVPPADRKVAHREPDVPAVSPRTDSHLESDDHPTRLESDDHPRTDVAGQPEGVERGPPPQESSQGGDLPGRAVVSLDLPLEADEAAADQMGLFWVSSSRWLRQ